MKKVHNVVGKNSCNDFLKNVKPISSRLLFFVWYRVGVKYLCTNVSNSSYTFLSNLPIFLFNRGDEISFGFYVWRVTHSKIKAVFDGSQTQRVAFQNFSTRLKISIVSSYNGSSGFNETLPPQISVPLFVDYDEIPA